MTERSVRTTKKLLPHLHEHPELERLVTNGIDSIEQGESLEDYKRGLALRICKNVREIFGLKAGMAFAGQIVEELFE